jgi:N-acetylmuramoyl-L-alanine amidase
MADCILKLRNNGRARAALAALALLIPEVWGASAGKAPANTAGTSAKVTSVRFWSLGEVTRISIEVSSDFKYKSDRLPDPDRLFFDIQGARPAISEKGMHVVEVGDTLLKQIRVAETQPGVTRVVLDLEAHNPPVTFTASQLSNPNRLMVELSLKDKPAPPITGSVSGVKTLADAPLNELAPDLASAAALPAGLPAGFDVKSVSAPIVFAKPAARVFQPPPPAPPAPLPRLTMYSSTPPDLPPPALAKLSIPAARVNFSAPAVAVLKSTAPTVTSTPLPPVKDALPAKTNSIGDPSLTRVLGLKLGRVVIDAGHGGHDAGTHGVSGLLEKDVVLDVALRLGTLLRERLGSDVVYTRSDDTYIPLEERTQIANDHKADLFLSIHANSSPFKAVGGVEVYYLNFTTTKTSLDLAAKENAGSQSSIFDLKDVLAKIAMKDKIDESREFANSLQTSLYAVSAKSNAAVKNRGIKKAPFVVLIGASMPSVLAEIGFLTNATDEALLKKPEQRQKIAEALYKGVASYADSLSHFQVAKRD